MSEIIHTGKTELAQIDAKDRWEAHRRKSDWWLICNKLALEQLRAWVKFHLKVIHGRVPQPIGKRSTAYRRKSVARCQVCGDENRIEAIDVHRQITGQSEEEATQWFEEYEREKRAYHEWEQGND